MTSDAMMRRFQKRRITMSMFKITMISAALALAAPVVAHATPSFQDCTYNTSDCYAGTNLVGKKVTTYRLDEGGNPEGLDPFARVPGKRVVKILEPAVTPYTGGNLSN
jgi:hypothetical protein